MGYQDKIALFPGSFDPFHYGHLHLISLALKKFSKIIICISNNDNKIQTPIQIRFFQVVSFLKKHKLYFNVIINENSTIDICKQLGIKYIVRGFRNKKDKKYELALKKSYLKQDKNIKVVLLKGKKFLNLNSTKLKNTDI